MHVAQVQLGAFQTKLTLCANYEAYFGQGTKLTVLETGYNITAPSVKVLGPSNNECGKKTLVCVATDFYPDHVSVSWQVDGREQTVGVATDSRAERAGRYYRISSRLRVPERSWFMAGRRFTCIVRFYNGAKYIERHAEAFGIQGTAQGSRRDKYMTVAQTAKASYVVFIVKSCVYGGFVAILLWKHQKSTGKRSS
ncbi:M1-specific T cell receptor beta chain [Nelusetta ayraudi]|uniref:M1-specific T cell receptor beta chain n=1 Tax=Nelusetta ayraudi TaxID=303726 RepID=UPI003F71D4E6